MGRSAIWRHGMPPEKKPFHEVLANMLTAAPNGIMRMNKFEKAQELMKLLDILYLSKMPAASAHRIAEENAGLPDWLIGAGLSAVAGRTAAVLDDLKNRKDDLPAEIPKKPLICAKCGSVTLLRDPTYPWDPGVIEAYPYGCDNGCVPASQAQMDLHVGQVYQEPK